MREGWEKGAPLPSRQGSEPPHPTQPHPIPLSLGNSFSPTLHAAPWSLFCWAVYLSHAQESQSGTALGVDDMGDGPGCHGWAVQCMHTHIHVHTCVSSPCSGGAGPGMYGWSGTSLGCLFEFSSIGQEVETAYEIRDSSVETRMCSHPNFRGTKLVL